MSSILDKPIVLSLNRNWQVIGHRIVRDALVAMMGGSTGVAPAIGLDIGYEKNADGTWDFSKPTYINPVEWNDWMHLPIREFDMFITTAKTRIRVPTVQLAPNFAQMPRRTPRVSREAIFARDGGICQYSGEYVGLEDGNLDHVVPRDQGGTSSFENLVWSKISINSAKANRKPHEAGLRLIRPPRAPLPVPMSATIRHARHFDWRHFMNST